MADFVCPQCGEHCFEQMRPATVKATICFYGSGGTSYGVDQAEEIESIERDEEIICRECGFEVEGDGSNLITREAFDEQENDPANW